MKVRVRTGAECDEKHLEKDEASVTRARDGGCRFMGHMEHVTQNPAGDICNFA